MPIIKCASVDCKYNDDHNKCTAKRIVLNDTYTSGFEHFHRCKTYEMDEETVIIDKQYREVMGKCTH